MKNMISRTPRLAVILSGQYRGCACQRALQDTKRGPPSRGTIGSVADRWIHTRSDESLRSQCETTDSALQHRLLDTPSDREQDRIHDGSCVPYVPFAGVQDSFRASLANAMTLTSSEREAFERLRKSAPPQRVVDQNARHHPQTTDSQLQDRRQVSSALDTLLDELDKRTRNSSSTGVLWQDKLPEQHNSQTVLRRHRETEHKRIQRRLATAKSDIKVWAILKAEIMAPVTALQLDCPKQEMRDSTSTRGLDVLGAILPTLLDDTARTLRERFPHSPLILAIIPLLKSTGPSAYALGASTELYNHVLGHLLEENADLIGMLDILNEMDRHVIAPNQLTVAVLQRAIDFQKRVYQGRFGYAAKLAWSSARNQKAVAGLRAWLDRVRAVEEPLFDLDDE